MSKNINVNVDLDFIQKLLAKRGKNVPLEVLQKACENHITAKRALTDPTTTPFTTYDVEDLEMTSLITTPKNTPLVNILKSRGQVQKAKSQQFFWNEVEVLSDFSNVLYDGNTVPSDYAGDPTRNNNYIMPIATVPKVSKFTNSFETTDDNPMQNELNQKFIDINRGLEYWLWNGDDSVTSPIRQTDGIKNRVTQAVDNGGGAVAKSSIDTVIHEVAALGGEITHIFTNSIKAMRIANFRSDSVAPRSGMEVQNGVDKSGLVYLSPFGNPIQIVPTLDVYVPTGQVFCLDLNYVKIRHTMDALINLERLGIITHGDALIYFSFFGLEIKGADKFHRVVTNCSESL